MDSYNLPSTSQTDDVVKEQARVRAQQEEQQRLQQQAQLEAQQATEVPEEPPEDPSHLAQIPEAGDFLKDQARALPRVLINHMGPIANAAAPLLNQLPSEAFGGVEVGDLVNDTLNAPEIIGNQLTQSAGQLADLAKDTVLSNVSNLVGNENLEQVDNALGTELARTPENTPWTEQYQMAEYDLGMMEAQTWPGKVAVGILKFGASGVASVSYTHLTVTTTPYGETQVGGGE